MLFLLACFSAMLLDEVPGRTFYFKTYLYCSSWLHTLSPLLTPDWVASHPFHSEHPFSCHGLFIFPFSPGSFYGLCSFLSFNLGTSELNVLLRQNPPSPKIGQLYSSTTGSDCPLRSSTPDLSLSTSPITRANILFRLYLYTVMGPLPGPISVTDLRRHSDFSSLLPLSAARTIQNGNLLSLLPY